MQSDLNLSLVLDHISDAFSIIDRDWNYLYSNARAAAITGKSQAELIGTKVWEVFPEAVGTSFYHQVQRAMSEQETVRFEEYSPETGFWFEIRCYPVPEGIVVFVQDITAAKRAEQALQENEERFRCLATATAQIVWTTAAGGTFAQDLPGWSEFTGLSLEPGDQTGWAAAVHPEDVGYTSEAWTHSMATGEIFQVEHRLRRRDGVYRHMLVRGVPIRDAAGNIREWIGTHNDITDRKAAEAERQALLESEQRSLAEAEARGREATALAQELQIERDRLQKTVDELATLSSQLQEQQEHQARVTRYLRGATRTASQLVSLADRNEILSTVVGALHYDFNMSVAGIWLQGERPNQFCLAAERGLAQSPSRMLEPDTDILLNPYKLGWVARMKRPFISNQLAGDIQLDQAWLEQQNLRSAAFYPLLDQDELIGIMVAFSSQELPLEASEILTTIVTILASSLRRETAG